MSSLHYFGFKGSAPRKRQKADESAAELQTTSTDTEVSEPLNDRSIAKRTIHFPWAVYKFPVKKLARGEIVHAWSCSTCDPDDNKAAMSLRDAADFRSHANTMAHKQAAENLISAQNMQDARVSHAQKEIQAVTSEAGRLLCVVAWLVANSCSLSLFPQVCSLFLFYSSHFSTFHTFFTQLSSCADSCSL
jgi:hypothetical protein